MISSETLVAQKHTTEASPLVDRVGSTGFLQVEAESFNALNTRQKTLAYWLSRAAINLDPITYDQMSRFGLRQKLILELIVANPKGIDPASLEKITDFTKLFWANHGNHNDVTAQKILPEFTPAELEKAAVKALQNAPQKPMSADALRRELEQLRPSLFDPEFEPQLTAKSPKGGKDIIQASANNFYAPDVTLAEVEKLKEQHPLNSRVAKNAEGMVVEEVYRAGTDDGSVPAGKYATELKRAIDHLRRAKPFAEPGQASVIDALIRYYQTGDARDWIAFGKAWVENNPRVDFVHGFIESYRDARGAKGTASSYVSIVDETLNHIMVDLAKNAQYFEDKAPWADMYKKQGVRPPVAKAVETVIETGDMGVTTVGQNLPNENEIRESVGTKNFFFTGSTRALNRARGTKILNEFAYSDKEKEIGRKYGEEANDLLTALHEVIGHGSGKVNPRLTVDPGEMLEEYYSTLEEARADLMAMWHAPDPKLRELGIVSHPDVARAMYNSQIMAPLIQLRAIPKGETIEEDHQRNRQLIVEYIMDKVPGAIERVHRDGKTYMHMIDFDKAHKGVGMLLAEIMRIKGEGDYDAAKALVEKYAVHFDPAIRDEVIARYKTLDLPTYFAGVHPDLHVKQDAKGKVTAVTMSYPRDVVKQRLRWRALECGGLPPLSSQSGGKPPHSKATRSSGVSRRSS